MEIRPRIFLLFLFMYLSCMIYGQISHEADSIIYTNDNKVFIQIFNDDHWLSLDGDYKEYRVYNSEGFYCFSLFRNDLGFLRDNKKNTLLLKLAVNPDRDLIFISDSFNTNFINVLDNIEAENFQKKYYSALNYFYKIPDYRLDSNIVKYLESNKDIHFDRYLAENNTRDTLIDEVEEYISLGPNVPFLLPNRYKTFTNKVLSNLKLSKSEKKRNDNKLYFRIIANWRGEIEELICLSNISSKNLKRLNKQIEFLKEIGLQPQPRGVRLKLKAVFYINVD